MPVCRVSSTNSRPSCCMPIWCSLCGCASIAKRGVWAGYRYGRQIADDYMRLLGQGDSQVLRWLEAEKDPRLTEIVTHLNQVVEGARIR
ncbi:formate hydrogenlyase subunit 7 [Klebsiella pneumoniae]|uniref:Formate hydrogenlyase subunit 7 n=1 Tax=Klebsiella pneumoniae TaxID=573 RepID=A0A2X1QUC1_KLEPN|nr:formate hydrogenlyase subunit 7 [Klebsiella pneumoniae]